MTSNKLRVQRFRTNDLNNNGGKQFELGKGWCEDFFEISPSLSEATFVLVFKPLCIEHTAFLNKEIELKLAEITNRGDRKAYANGQHGLSQIKNLFIDDLRLNETDNLSDYFAIYKASFNQYYLYYIPQLLYNNFIKLFESITPDISIQRDPKRALTNLIDGYPLQQIFYGAPGTGKSHEIKKLTKGESVIRTTFHPDSDYSTFVGCYKPTMDEVDTQVVPVVVKSGISLQDPGTYKEKRITYKFVMQAFLKAYLGAWKKWADAGDDGVAPQFLVIEEINRGNCAQIFGDLFQLLDRSDNNFSEYPIEADTDLQQEIERAFKEHKDYKLTKAINVEGVVKDYISNYDSTLSEDIQSGRILLLPPNLYIWATMNTSDQSLFPIDSAFKRRWEWKYMKIVRPYKKNDDGSFKLNENGEKIPFDFKIEGDHDWWAFLQQINAIIDKMTNSADKQLGYFFAKAKDDIISYDTFVSKVCFYLWNDIFKTYALDEQQGDLFSYTIEEGKKEQLTFPAFYDGDGNVIPAVVEAFINNVMDWNTKNDKA